VQFSGRKCESAQLVRPPFAATFGCAGVAFGAGLAVVIVPVCNSAQLCRPRRQRATAKQMATRLDRMAFSKASNLRQSRESLLSQRIIPSVRNRSLVRETAYRGASNSSSRQQRLRGGSRVSIAKCVPQLHCPFLSSTLNSPNLPLLQRPIFCPEACSPCFPLRTRPSASLCHLRSPSHSDCAAFHIQYTSPRLLHRKDSARPSSSAGIISIIQPINHDFPRPPNR
jgi:hypothetical protein